MISEHVKSRKDIALTPEFYARLDEIRARGYEMMASAQTAGVFNLSAPILGPDQRGIAALTVPYISLVNAPSAPDISMTISLLQKTAEQLSLLAGSDVQHERPAES